MTMNADWDYATKFRDVMVQICEGAIARLRPDSRYATVISIDRANRKCVVTFPGETVQVSIPMGSIQPSKPGQTVRVAGTLGDRYLDDVMGEAILAGSTPTGVILQWPLPAIPLGYIAANGSYLDPASYPSLYAVYGFSQGQQGPLFRVPTVAGGIIRAT